ncbi:hypothetical protein [Streptomyces sp. A5-4]|uniref:hypothetical protein n=1 Tax=Streptomyces sp. A5-4 TaxID=3384771 RepID=UPI003DA8664E
MSAAHLHAVPDPEPDEEPSPEEWPAPVPAVVAPPAPAGDEPEDPTADDVAEDDDEDLDDEEPGEQPGSWIPDLRPYYDVRPLAELGPLAVEAGRTAGPPLLRGLRRGSRWTLIGLGRLVVTLARMSAWYWSGLRVLLALLLGWLSGSYGKRGSVGARLCGAGFAAYGTVSTAATFPIAPWVIGGALLASVVLAATGRITLPKSKPAKKEEKGEKKATGKAAEQKTGKPTVGKVEVEKEDAPALARGGLLTRFTRRAKASAVTPEDGSPDASDEAGEEAPEEAEGTPEEDPLTALIREQIGTENGVHLQDLRPAMREALPGLSEATDEELRQALTGAGWDPSRKFRARGAAGRAGVHRNQLPPRLSPGSGPGPLSEPLSTAGDRPRPANSSEAESGGEWTEEDLERGWRYVQDHKRGPAAWIIQQYGGDLK